MTAPKVNYTCQSSTTLGHHVLLLTVKEVQGEK